MSSVQPSNSFEAPNMFALDLLVAWTLVVISPTSHSLWKVVQSLMESLACMLRGLLLAHH